MIPRICVNCQKGDNVGDGQTVYGTVCGATPLRLWKRPDDTCWQFVMDENPSYSVSDAQEGAHAAQDGTVQGYADESPSEAARAFDDMMGNPMEAVDDLIEVEQ